jgi:hypothetical protein
MIRIIDVLAVHNVMEFGSKVGARAILGSGARASRAGPQARRRAAVIRTSAPQYDRLDRISRYLLQLLRYIFDVTSAAPSALTERPEPDPRVIDAFSWCLGAEAASPVTDEARTGLRWHRVAKVRETRTVTCPGGAPVDEFHSWPL